ncbi:MAG: hypothetical protein ABUS57_20260 [Pseudomonadota bacterium]
MGKFRQPLLYAITAGFVAISVFMIASGESLGGAMGLCFFGGCAIVFLAEPAGVYGRKAASIRRAVDAQAVQFGFNRPHLAVMALGGVLMGAGAGLMGLLGAPKWFAWPAGALALVGALMLASRAFDRRPVVMIDATGFFDRRILRAPLRWEHTDALGFAGAFGLPFMTLHPADGAPVSAHKRRLRVTDMQLDGGLADMLAAIHRFRPQINILAPED